jgi:adenylosuccinate synthase
VPGLAVIGLQWGDEAKGKLVDRLTEGQDWVVRYQGGANAGHTVVVGGKTYKLHLIPSGILNPSVTNIVSAGVVLDPATILREIEGLRLQGIHVAGRLLLSDRAHVVFPWHIIEDKVWNEMVSGSDNLGTTLRGIGPCYRDKVGRSFAIRLGDLAQDNLGRRIQEIVKFKQASFRGFDTSISVELDADSIYEQYRGYAEALRPLITDTTALLLDAVARDARILFEGAQGSLLDIDYGTFPFVTSSNSSGVGITAGAGVPPHFVSKIIGVVKAYSTRVGGGPFPTELLDETGERIRRRGNEYGTTTGRPRRCGWFDAVAVRYAARLSGVSALAVTMLDVLSGFQEIRVCVGYDMGGRRVEVFTGQAQDLANAQPIYESLPGFDDDITHCQSIEQLPATARRYLDRLSDLVGVPIELISVGPDRAQTIVASAVQLV